MGMWDKFKQLKAGIEAVSSAVTTSDRTLHIKGHNDVVVVAGEYYSKDSQRVPIGQQFTVELRREPKNAHDGNAIMVLHMGRQIGYFSAFKAERYAQLLDIAARQGQTIQATAGAQKTAHGDKITNVQMPSVYELAVQLGPAADHVAAANKPPVEATFKQLAKYQDQLKGVLAGMPQREVKASIVLRETPSGKYKGKNLVSFMYQGEEIGVLPAQYRESHQEFFEAAESGVTKCMVLIRHYDEKIWARASVY
ncbi:HIRAN domain-containing protein [Pseudarthrobacter sp. LT1]|uniref:HIRAN domain-containing protein n=1 Tax=Pseudarthrobacter sp. LT1 TaxID=3111450 RepID=UPI002D772A34|nr:HIRAN domain-containing protein [Pseudarthrobacter sp. LT1]WRT15614.1 HIRAN domain-containing protein [Pseudarthrobacter sp. LT1]